MPETDENIILLGNEILLATKGNEIKHFEELNIILDTIEKLGLKIKPQRMTIAKQEFTFGNIKMKIQDSEKLHTTKQITEKSTKKQTKNTKNQATNVKRQIIK